MSFTLYLTKTSDIYIKDYLYKGFKQVDPLYSTELI